MMEEGEIIAKRLGVDLRLSIERRIEGARRVGRHRSSMLQDADSGEPMEIDALVTAIVELGELTATDTPAIRHVLALTRLLNQVIIEERVGIYNGTRT
jgi:2-dehydropantoate 2-reductase